MLRSAEAASALRQAEHWLDLGRPERALQALQDAAAPDDPAVLSMAATAYLMAGRAEEAVTTAERALRHGPAVQPLAVIASAYADPQPGKAEEALLEALRLAPGSPFLVGQYAMLVAASGQFEKARLLIDRAQLIDPRDPELHLVRSRIEYLSGDDRAARRSAETAMSQDPWNLRARLVLGSLHLEQGRAAAGRKLLDTAAADRPDQRGVIASARAARALAHPLLAPLRLEHRVGPVRLWVGAIVVFVVLASTGRSRAAVAVATGYAVFAVYTRIGGLLVRRHVERRR